MKVELTTNQIQGLEIAGGHVVTTLEKINEHLGPVLRDLYTDPHYAPNWGSEHRAPHVPPTHPMFTHGDVTQGLLDVNKNKAIGPDMFDFKAFKEGCTESEWAIISTRTVNWVYQWMNKDGSFPDWVR